MDGDQRRPALSKMGIAAGRPRQHKMSVVYMTQNSKRDDDVAPV